MMFTSGIKTVLLNLKQQLLELSNSSTVVYDAQPLIDLTKRIIDIVEREGIPKLDVHEVDVTEEMLSSYFNDFSDSLSKIILTISRIMDELVESTNQTLIEYNNKDNEIKPVIESLQQRMIDIRQQVLEKATNKSIFDHEIKNIDFTRNVVTNSLTVVNNALLLPILSQTRVNPNNIDMSILESNGAKVFLNREMIATEGYTDAQILAGTYVGNIVGLLDGSENFITDDTVIPANLFNTNANETVPFNYLSKNRNEKLTVAFSASFSTQTKVNFISIIASEDPQAKVVSGNEATKITLKNGIWPISKDIDTLALTFTNDRARRFRYQGIDLIDKATGHLIRRFNYMASLNHLYEDVFKTGLPKITTSAIAPTETQQIKLDDRVDFFRYHLNISQVNMFVNQYGPAGTWESAAITTLDPIASVDISTDEFVPDDTAEYITYEISFDRNTWYPIRPDNQGITQFNNNKKRRIVIGNEITHPEFLVVPNLTDIQTLFVRVKMSSNISGASPVLYNLQIRVKVDK